MPAEFHFLSPFWFLALAPLALLLMILARRRGGLDAWRRVVDERLLVALGVADDGPARRWPLALLGLGWVVAVIALANPTFERLEVPAFRDAAARVVALDLSQSMLAEDLAPNRLARARYKVEDLLRRGAAGQTGLVVFAGDAFAVVPLTDDAESIRAVLPVLEPDLMPVQGSRVDLGLSAALDLLRQAGVPEGEVVLLTDAAGDERARDAAAELRDAGHRLAVIGVGTEEGAPVPGVRSSRGVVLSRLEPGGLRGMAREGGGAYAGITADEGDLDRVLADAGRRVRAGEEARRIEVWRALGPWLTLLLLPLAALGFRRGWALLPVLLALNLSPAVQAPVFAADEVAPQPEVEGGGSHGRGGWRGIWERPDQQAAGALERGNYERAAELARDPARIGAARYRMGDYAGAARALQGVEDSAAHYNRGNALAMDGQLEEALAAYDEALSQSPDMEDARHNRSEVERALREQQQAQQTNQQQDQQDQQDQQGQQGQQGQQDQKGQQGRQGQDASQGDAGRSDGEQEASAADRSVDDDAGADETSAADDSDTRPDSADARGRSGEQDRDASTDSRPDGGQDSSDTENVGAGPDEETSDEARARREREAQAADDYRREARAAGGEAESDAETQSDKDIGGAGGEGKDPAQREARRAADQWLRRIPDDPGGLLRRKFMYQYRMRAGGADNIGEDPW